MLGTILKFTGTWIFITLCFAVGNGWRTGDPDWWNAALYSAVIIGGLHFYSTTLERLDKLERELQRLQGENEQLTAEFHHYVRRQKLGQ